MILPPVADRKLPPAFTPGMSTRTRGGEERRETGPDVALTVRVTALARQLRDDEADPTLDPARKRRDPADERRTDPRLAQLARDAGEQPEAPDDGDDGGNERGTGNERGSERGSARQGAELSSEDARRVEQLRARDREVRAHEQAHIAAAGGLAGSPKYEFQVGADGRRYAVGGEVSINVAAGRTPQETLKRAATIRAAANAPAQPSGQDQSVAARAGQMATDARVELARREAEERTTREAKATDARDTRNDEARRNEERAAEARSEAARAATAQSADRPAVRNAIREEARAGARRDEPREAPDAPDALEPPEARDAPDALEPPEAPDAPELSALPPTPTPSVTPSSVSYRGGGVSGGHMHASLHCSFCSAGIAAYRSGG